MRRRLLLLAAWIAASPAQASDVWTAHRLYLEGRHAEAAELFSDPAWKGAALYKSGQWWRAVEAFVRASDPDSLFNLGNAYAQLGYYALALESYRAALARRPDFPDAAFNAGVMRELLARAEDNKGQAALQPKARAIDEVDEKPKPEDDKAAESGDQKDGAERRREEQQKGESKDQQESDATDATKGGAKGDTPGGERPQEDGKDGASRTQGGKPEGEREEQAEQAAASSESAEAADPKSAALRARLEGAQATEQWLNTISDNPARFLKSRIALEARRRKAAGNAPDEGQSPW